MEDINIALCEYKLTKAKQIADLVYVMGVFDEIYITEQGYHRKQRYFCIHHDLMWEYGKYFSSTVLLESTENSSILTMI